MRFRTFAATLLLGGLLAAPPAQAWNPFGEQFEGYRHLGEQRSNPRRSSPAPRPERSEPRSSPSRQQFPEVLSGGGKPSIGAIQPESVNFPSSYGAGTVVIDTRGRQLFYVLSGNRAYRYPISVGRDGFQWSGTKRITRVANWPDWRPPAEMRERQPGLPKLMTGGVRNPLGAKALYLGSSLYRIHGTNSARTIGYAASSGCFRMLNGHVVHLSRYAKVGTKVVVLKGLPNSLRRTVAGQVASPSAAARRAAGI
ncbi:MAG: hypothetical protein RLZ98_507 [Pseudomonadota bacterium]|jgi:lipoprotein-anchoring transpeptidase ErfK/SrfK